MTARTFAKYQAAGNDFVVVEDLEGEFPISAEEATALCDRWTGVGADGVIRVGAGRATAFAFELWNADGSTSAMSGNGMRCLGAYVFERGLTDERSFEVWTPAGVRRVELETDGSDVTGGIVDMGTPGFTKAQIPMVGPAWETFLGQPFDLGDGRSTVASALSMGNPHLVLFLEEDPERYHVEHIGPALERHEWFPERTNVEFARVGPDRIDVRVWERGVGETLACGTGACAVAVAAHETGLAQGSVVVRFRGGDLRVTRASDGTVRLGGPVAFVFEGTVDAAVL
jgi:diaminopimelate epimerase